MSDTAAVWTYSQPAKKGSLMSPESSLLMPCELRGVEVVLRPLSMDDAEALAVAAAESREHYRFNPVPNGLEEARRSLARALRIAVGRPVTRPPPHRSRRAE